MAENEARFCPICRGEMEFLPRYYIWRYTAHGLFLHNQLEPHEQSSSPTSADLQGVRAGQPTPHLLVLRCHSPVSHRALSYIPVHLAGAARPRG